jgi:putative Ca2+/H+ antiporter (TMEM165/GDT1 family)
MVASDAIGIAIGVIMRRHIPEKAIKWFSAAVFILFGLNGIFRAF